MAWMMKILLPDLLPTDFDDHILRADDLLLLHIGADQERIKKKRGNKMGRLIKYELKKQQTSRNIILALLLVFLLAVVVGTFTENGNTVGISVMLEMFVGMFVFFYMGIESLLILNRDLKTKQSHMLWMVPMQSWKILGAKYIAAILQIFFISAAYVLAAIACILSLIAKMDAWEELFKGLRIGAEWLFQGNMDWIDTYGNLSVFLLCIGPV